MNDFFGIIRLEYGFQYETGITESLRYINEYAIRIYLDQYFPGESGDRVESVEIGRASVSLFLVELGHNNDQSTFDIFDHSVEYINLFEELYDEDEEFIEAIKNGREIDQFNVLYIRNLALLPQWRGRGIGKKILKDIIWRFTGCFGLGVLKSFQLQFEWGILEQTDLWTQQLLLANLSKNQRSSQKKLNAFYQSVGFRELPNSDWHYLNMIHVNRKLDQISLEDSEKIV
ncbi:GNAT family N-acetyltransferase [Larkinella sp. GY13]|uniref:GNAT family N-acetyltransferase n=1 Tax=Larkinella sp. GY13 TaxID=3453720 RepID=UPI003EEBFF4D